MSYNQIDLVVLKAICTDKKIASDFANNCVPEYFSNDLLRFAKIICNYILAYKNPPTLKILVEKNTPNKSLIEYIEKIWAVVDAVSFNEKEYPVELEKLKERYLQNQIEELRTSLNKDGVSINDAAKNISKALGTIKSINAKQTTINKSIKTHLAQFTSEYQDKRKNGEDRSGLSTGFSTLDDSMGKLKPTDFLLYCGETGAGKSVLLSNTAKHIWMGENKISQKTDWKPGHNIAYFSLEMPYGDCFTRLLSSMTNIPYKKIDQAKCTRDEVVRLKEAMDFINIYPYNFHIIDIPRIAKPIDIENILVQLLEKEDIDFIAIDYLGLMSPNSGADEADWQKQSTVCYELREILRAYSIAGATALQLNRRTSTMKDSDVVSLSRLARSSGIATHVTCVVQLETRTNEKAHPDAFYHILKNRKGNLGAGRLIKNLACSEFVDDPISEENSFLDEDIFQEYEDLEFKNADDTNQ